MVLCGFLRLELRRKDPAGVRETLQEGDCVWTGRPQVRSVRNSERTAREMQNGNIGGTG